MANPESVRRLAKASERLRKGREEDNAKKIAGVMLVELSVLAAFVIMAFYAGTFV